MSDIQPIYCIDTNTVVSFVKKTDDEFYGADVFGEQWNIFEDLMASGLMVASIKVKKELEKWKDKSPEIKEWIKNHSHIFVNIDDVQLLSAASIVARYDAYTKNENYANDLAVISLAHSKDLTLVTLERIANPHAETKPKIPNVCNEFGVNVVSVSGFLRLEQARKQDAVPETTSPEASLA